MANSTARIESTEPRYLELRLAIVCYGGVALAVYMHGVTKELGKLAEASAAFERLGYDPAADNPFPDDDTAGTYFDVLAGLAQRGTRIRVVIDIISGTSAGGINGVVLGKSIARGASQDGLKELWLRQADLKKFLRPKWFGTLWMRGLVSLIALAVRSGKATAPMSGSFLSRNLVTAITGMDSLESDSLIADGRSLDLFVTTTDLHGYQSVVSTGGTGIGQRATNFGQVLEFRATSEDTEEFGPGHSAALAFAARATSCFPGAFTPVSLDGFARESRSRLDPKTVRFRDDYSEEGIDPRSSWFVDGGLLDNAPFDLAIDAIAAKRANSQVVRRLLYIEPDPGPALTMRPGRKRQEAPTWMSGVAKSILGAKGSHSFLPELLKLRDMNARIAQISVIAKSQEDVVFEALREAGLTVVDKHVLYQHDGTAAIRLDVPAEDGDEIPEAVKSVADQMHRIAAGQLGPTFPTYSRLKATETIERLTEELIKHQGFSIRSDRAALLAAAFQEWMHTQSVWLDSDAFALGKWLRDKDMPYRERRLQFVLAGINEMYSEAGISVSADELDALKAAAWEAHGEIGRAQRDTVSSWDDDLLDFLTPESLDAATVDGPAAFAAKYGDRIARVVDEYGKGLGHELPDYSARLWIEFTRLTASWEDRPRLRLLSRWLGMPLWDGMIYPIVALSRLPQYSPIAVAQFSPPMAQRLEPMPGTEKLKGAGTFHFGGFFDRAWRENDYLWGRLDSVELILGQIREAAAANATTTMASAGDDLPDALDDGLGRVLRSENDLGGVRELLEHLGAQVTNRAGSMTPP